MFTATAIAISIASYHFDRKVEHNEVNPGVFVELNHDYVVGVYRNSHWRTTVLAVRQFQFGSIGPAQVGAMVGVCSGYETPICGGLTVAVGNVSFLIVPPIKASDGATRGVIGVSWRQPL